MFSALFTATKIWDSISSYSAFSNSPEITPEDASISSKVLSAAQSAFGYINEQLSWKSRMLLLGGAALWAYRYWKGNPGNTVNNANKVQKTVGKDGTSLSVLLDDNDSEKRLEQVSRRSLSRTRNRQGYDAFGASRAGSNLHKLLPTRIAG